MSTSRITSKGQVTIPRSIRERMGLRAGDRLAFVVDPDGTLIIEPVEASGERPSLAGFLAGRVEVPAPVTVDRMDRGIADAMRSKHLRASGHDGARS